jgi:hypothetical protein
VPKYVAGASALGHGLDRRRVADVEALDLADAATPQGLVGARLVDAEQDGLLAAQVGHAVELTIMLRGIAGAPFSSRI